MPTVMGEKDETHRIRFVFIEDSVEQRTKAIMRIGEFLSELIYNLGTMKHCKQ